MIQIKRLCAVGGRNRFIPGAGRMENFLLRAKSRLITQNSVFNGCITGWLQLAFLA